MTIPSDEQPQAHEALAREFERWQKEYFDEVDAPFARQDKARGEVAYSAWEQRFLSFIQQEAPLIVPLYQSQVWRRSLSWILGPTTHQQWKQCKGNAIEALLIQAIQDARAGRLAPSSAVKPQAASTSSSTFIDNNRIKELKALTSPQFDITRLVKMCEEANICYEKDCLLAVVMLSRAMIDHVPPIFGQTSFAQVASTYTPKSVKASLLHLEETLRNIADSALHTHIRRKETLPTRTQVNFSAELDVLLGEVSRVLAPKT